MIKTSITCNSSDNVLEMYTYVSTIAAQYDICLTPLDNITKWIDPSDTQPSTFPFYKTEFESNENF